MQKQALLKTIFCLVFAFFIFSPTLNAQSAQAESPNETLRVALAGSEPFIIHSETGEGPSGIAVEIWENIAEDRNLNYRYESFGSVGEAISALGNGSVDLIVGPVSITSERVLEMGFSQPYYQSSLAIVSQATNPNLWEKIKPLFSLKLLIAVGVFLLILAVVGTLIWLAERHESPEEFTTDPVKGIGNGMWLAVVTMSTVGYGDMAPVTLKGRIIVGSWIVISIIFATSMVAGIASTLTLSSLSSTTVTTVEQLSGKKVATVEGSSSESFLKEHNAKEVPAENLEDALAKLKNGDAYAVVYDRPQLKYLLKDKEKGEFYLAKAEYYKQGYGFAFPMESTLVHDVNRTLLELAEDHSKARIIDFYLGGEDE